MKDKFADFEDRRSGSKSFVVVALVLFGIFAVYRWSTSDLQPIHGKVESVGASSAAKGHEPGVDTVSVRLSDGSLVAADVVSGGPVSVGDQVRLVMRPTSAIGSPYEVVAKLHGPAP